MKERFEQKNFELVSPFKPTGDQPEAIEKLVDGLESGLKEVILYPHDIIIEDGVFPPGCCVREPHPPRISEEQDLYF